MKHHSKTKKLGRVKRQRGALLSGLALSLIRDGRIQTTEAKAKALRPVIEKLITKAKDAEDNAAAYRMLLSRLSNNKEMVKKLVGDIAPRYTDRNGGYTRIVKLPPRASDASYMAIIEFV